MMLGHLMEWFFSGIGGIRQMPGSKAYDHVLISPEIVGDITWAETSFQSVHGKISSSWEISDHNFSLKVAIPVNCKATIVIPQSDADKISENGIPVRSSGNITIKNESAGRILLETGSGQYLFKSPI
jgi:hypothetical protein